MATEQKTPDSTHPSDVTRPLDLLGLAVTGIFTAAGVGALTNSINGLVSPLYFVNILGWHDVDNVWRASIAQGIFEGLIFGALLALIFTTVVGLVTKASCLYRVSVRYVFGILGVAFASWILGGVLAIALAALSPEFYRHAIIGVPKPTGEMLRYAWVGGSIVGIEIGGFIAVVLGSVLFSSKWCRK